MKRRKATSGFSPLSGLDTQGLVTQGNAALQRQDTPAPAIPISRQRRRRPSIRVSVSPDDKRAFDSLCVRLGDQLDAAVQPSNLLRACIGLLRRAEQRVIAAASANGPLYRPPNDDVYGMARFDDAITGLLESALSQHPRR